MIINKKIILKKTALDIPIILFLISLILSTIFSIDKTTSLFGYYGRFNGGTISIVSYILLYYGFLSNNLSYKSILKISLISSIIVILWGLPGKIGHDLTCPTFKSVFLMLSDKFSLTNLGTIWTKQFDNSCWSTETNVFNPASRMFSTLGQPNWLGAFLAINFFISLYFLIKNKTNIKYLILNTIYLFLNFAVIIFTRSRSSLVAVIIGLFIFSGIYFFKQIKLYFLKYWKTILIGFFVLLLTSTIFYIKTSQKNEGTVTDSLDIRKIVWQGAISLGLKYPLFGTGVETFAYSYYFTRPASHNLTSEWDYLYNKAHNEYLNYFATTGFIGLLAYLYLIFNFQFLIFKQFLKNKFSNIEIPIKTKDYKLKANELEEITTKRLLLLCLGIAYLTILITNFFGFSTTSINLYFYLIPAFFLSINNSVNSEEIENKTINIFQIILIILISLFFVYILFSIIKYWIADTYYAEGINYSKPNIANYPKAALSFQQALKLHKEHVYEDKLSNSLAYTSALLALQKNEEDALKYLSVSDYFNISSLKSSPQNVLYWKTRARNFYLYYKVTEDLNELVEGINALKKAESLSPTEPKIPYSAAVYYLTIADNQKDLNLKKDNFIKAYEEINKSVKLKPNLEEAIILKKQIEEIMGSY